MPVALTPIVDPLLGEGTEWDGVDVRGDVGGPREVADVDIVGSRFVGVRLTGRGLTNLRMIDVVLEDCELSGVAITSGRLTRVVLRRCRLAGLVAPGLKARDVSLEDCTASGAAFRMSTWERSRLRDVVLRDADFQAARLSGTHLLRCDLTGADFSKADLVGAALHGSTLTGVRGAESLGGVVIGSDQLLALAVPVLAAMAVVVDDDFPVD